ncbi:MAG: hypothetical protein HY048_04465 [Acidobacteria bacterium]|nr:hypothetical protein [Acidobacteriota bacterium]
MAAMIRKQVYLDQRHDLMLKRRARQRGTTEAELIREALDRADAAPAAARHSTSSVDPAAGRKAVEFMRSLAARRATRPGKRTWTRDDLYKDRIGRWAKS